MPPSALQAQFTHSHADLIQTGYHTVLPSSDIHTVTCALINVTTVMPCYISNKFSKFGPVSIIVGNKNRTLHGTGCFAIDKIKIDIADVFP